MRNPERIKPYCDTLATIWGMVPDWRLGQLMVNAIFDYRKQHGYDFFYTEDEDFLAFLYKYVSSIASN